MPSTTSKKTFFQDHKILLSLLVVFSHLLQKTLSNYNAYNYDLTTPQFTPDGRLLQVEYAHAASQNSSPLLILSCTNDETKETCLVLATTSKKFQPRIISYPHRLGNVAIGLSGILSDNMFLLQHIKSSMINSFTRWYGLYSPFRMNDESIPKGKEMINVKNIVDQIARSIGSKCQEHSFGGGIRPFGASMVICGVDSDEKAYVCVTSPSGSVTSITEPCFVLGGATDRRKLLYDRFSSSLLEHKLINILREVVHALSEKHEEARLGDEVLECTIISSTQGIIRLDDRNIEDLLKQKLI